MAERERIARYFAPLASDEPGSFDLTDDAARLAVPHGKQLVVTTDSVFVGIHVLPNATPKQLAEKLVRRNLSDLAAMGAKPWRYLLNLHTNATVDEAWFASFAAALRHEQEYFHMVLAGGDSTAGVSDVHVSMTCLGLVDGAVVLRSTAHVNDDVYVSGTIGDAAIGLQMLRGNFPPNEHSIDRYHRPEPRLGLGHALVAIATSAIDISDGLLADAHQLAKASGLQFALERSAVPLSSSTQDLLAANETLWSLVLEGGDDYELLFTASPKKRDAIAALSARLDLPLTRIGTVMKGHGVMLDGQPVAAHGWEYR